MGSRDIFLWFSNKNDDHHKASIPSNKASNPAIVWIPNNNKTSISSHKTSKISRFLGARDIFLWIPNNNETTIPSNKASNPAIVWIPNNHPKKGLLDHPVRALQEPQLQEMHAVQEHTLL